MKNIKNMKKILSILICMAFLCSGCENMLRDELDELHREIDDMKARFEALTNEVNTNVEALKAIVAAIQDKDYVQDISPLYENDKEVGYIITFVKGGKITIYHGHDGKDGLAPEIGVRKDEDGIWYWTLNGEWLLDKNGNKVKASATDGKDGTVGVTPVFKIENDWWYVSYDKGATWTKLGKAKGEDGIDGTDGKDGKDGTESIFADIVWDDNCIYFILRDGSSITVNRNRKLQIVFEETSGIVCSPGKTATVKYTIQGGDSSTFVEALGDNGWNAKVMPSDTRSGVIRVTAPNPMTDGKVLVFANAGDGRTYVTSLTFTEGHIGVGNSVYHISYKGGEINVAVKTGLNYYVSIVKHPDWLSLKPETKSLRTDTLRFDIKANAFCQDRSATVELTDDYGVVESFMIVQHENVTEDGIICFKDNDVAGTCISRFDTDGDGFLSKLEARAVTDIGDFHRRNIVYFDEFQYFISVTSLQNRTFEQCTKLISVTLPSSITEIGQYAFSSCSSVKTMAIPNGVNTIRQGAFSGCSALTNIVLPPHLKVIEEATFSSCRGLETIIIPESVESIEHYVFYECHSLKSVEIPENVESIGESAFRNCSSLSEIVCYPLTPPELGDDAFRGIAPTPVFKVPAASLEQYKTANNWSALAPYMVAIE